MDEARHPEESGALDPLQPGPGAVGRRRDGNAGLPRLSWFAGVAA